MMDKDRKKDLVSGYFQRKKDGGIVAVCCGESGRRLILSVPDIRSYQNRFEFSRQTDTPVHIKLQEDWQKYGGAAFYLEIMETLARKAGQTDKEYFDDLTELLQTIEEKINPEELY